MATRRRNKAINFDLDTASLRGFFGETGRSGAYAAIRSFMEKNGFEHRQGSGYRSLRPFSEAEIVDLVVKMYEELAWQPDCVQKLDVTNIGREYDIHAIARARMEEASTELEFEIGL